MLCDVDSEGVVVDVLAISESLATCNTTTGFVDTDEVSVVDASLVRSAVPADTETPLAKLVH